MIALIDPAVRFRSPHVGNCMSCTEVGIRLALGEEDAIAMDRGPLEIYEAVGARSWEGVLMRRFGVEPTRSGTPEELLEIMARAGPGSIGAIGGWYTARDGRGGTFNGGHAFFMINKDGYVHVLDGQDGRGVRDLGELRRYDRLVLTVVQGAYRDRVPAADPGNPGFSQDEGRAVLDRVEEALAPVRDRIRIGFDDDDSFAWAHVEAVVQRLAAGDADPGPPVLPDPDLNGIHIVEDLPDKYGSAFDKYDNLADLRQGLAGVAPETPVIAIVSREAAGVTSVERLLLFKGNGGALYAVNPTGARPRLLPLEALGDRSMYVLVPEQGPSGLGGQIAPPVGPAGSSEGQGIARLESATNRLSDAVIEFRKLSPGDRPLPSPKLRQEFEARFKQLTSEVQLAAAEARADVGLGYLPPADRNMPVDKAVDEAALQLQRNAAYLRDVDGSAPVDHALRQNVLGELVLGEIRLHAALERFRQAVREGRIPVKADPLDAHWTAHIDWLAYSNEMKSMAKLEDPWNQFRTRALAEVAKAQLPVARAALVRKLAGSPATSGTQLEATLYSLRHYQENAEKHASFPVSLRLGTVTGPFESDVLEAEMRIRQLDAAGVAVDPADRAYVAQMHRLLERLLEGTGMELPSPTG